MWTVGVVAIGQKLDAGLFWCAVENEGRPGQKVIAYTEQTADAECIAAVLNKIGRPN
jgi:hypothetical protein